MPKLPALKPGDAIKSLEKAGFSFVRLLSQPLFLRNIVVVIVFVVAELARRSYLV